ncbi:MAG: sulfatase-like hydrolase/transferase [Akkermansiaceae bacterium]
MMKLKIRLLALLACALPCQAAERPNILWITCEDISPYLGSYGCTEAHTPHLDKLAEEGIRFTRAYANAPVCAVARSTLLTGMYASTTGTHQMRSRPQLPASIPNTSSSRQTGGNLRPHCQLRGFPQDRALADRRGNPCPDARPRLPRK